MLGGGGGGRERNESLRSPLDKLSRTLLMLLGLRMSFLIFDKKSSSSGNLDALGFQPFLSRIGGRWLRLSMYVDKWLLSAPLDLFP